MDLTPWIACAAALLELPVPAADEPKPRPPGEDRVKIYHLTECELRRLTMPRWAPYAIVGSCIAGVLVGRLLWWLAS